MQPRLFEIFDTGFPSYFVFLIIGFLMATTMGALWARRIGENPDVMVDLGISMLIFGVIGSRVLHVLADGFFMDYLNLCIEPGKVGWSISQSQCTRLQDTSLLGGLFGPEMQSIGVWDSAAQVCRPQERDCFAWARFWSGGLTYYGGFIGASLAAFFQLKRDQFPFFRGADMAGLTIPIGLAFGRLGCFLGGCCFGAPTNELWGLRFPAFSPASSIQAREGVLESSHILSLPVHPTQLYESWGAFLIAIWLLVIVHPRKRYDGQVFVSFVASYALLRFCIEFFRADDRGALFSLSTSQWIGIALLIAAGTTHLLKRKTKTKMSDIQG